MSLKFPLVLRAGPARLWLALTVVVALGLLVLPISAGATSAGFGFDAQDVSGISGAAGITGGGTGDHFAGGFRCLETVDHLGGPTAPGCPAGVGVRWDTVEVLSSTHFKCSPGDTPTLATTDEDTVVLSADFYRSTGGPDSGASVEFTNAQMIVSKGNLPDHPGVQVWIQGVGCGAAVGNLR